ncbi:sodium/hydrogen exchanger 9B2-like [Ornithodoros turicata]|uniref:sodium/hydrogen exchanger 9B2-like n=1 Tax=Ornithodoros turicata TaxID=34597 RepID=UPI003139F21D
MKESPIPLQSKRSPHSHRSPSSDAHEKPDTERTQSIVHLEHNVDEQQHNEQPQETKKKFLQCPPSGPVAQVLVFVIMLVLVWSSLWGLVGKEAEPGGHFFSLFFLIFLCYIAGMFAKLIQLPPLLGMLIMGFALRNIDAIDIAQYIDPVWGGDLRSMALILILLRAGLGLDPAVLRNLKGACLRLTFCPCLTECLIVTIASHFYLGFPWLWGTLLGFVLAAVSPAVVVPSMLWLQTEGYGMDKGIPTLVMAAASFDDVAAITGFGVAMGVVFATGDLAWTIAKGPVEAIVGMLYGGVVGLILWFLPDKDNNQKGTLRTALLIASGVTVMFVSRRFEFGGSGALGCISVAFVAAFGWKRETDGEAAASKTCSLLWEIFQPTLFGLIGAEVQLKNLDKATIFLGLAVIGTALLFRITVTFLVVYGSNLTVKERLFVAIAWLPKATVQAAIGSSALDFARTIKADDEVIKLATQVLTIAVLSILVTAPTGAAAIALSAPRLLHKTKPDEADGVIPVQPDANRH